jgi:hypothetical protein
MRLDLYQAETALIAQEQTALLDEARMTLCSGGSLSRLEQNGVLHAIHLKQHPSGYESSWGTMEH